VLPPERSVGSKIDLVADEKPVKRPIYKPSTAELKEVKTQIDDPVAPPQLGLQTVVICLRALSFFLGIPILRPRLPPKYPRHPQSTCNVSLPTALSSPARIALSVFCAQSNYLIFIITLPAGFWSSPKHLKACTRVKAYFLNDSELHLRPIGKLFSVSQWWRIPSSPL
jgi:hypothetical protein